MSRREFSKKVKRDAFMRANGQCEGQLVSGSRCGSRLEANKFHYDHDLPDALGGEPELWNCQVLCVACHKMKTAKQDMPRIAKVKRIQDREMGIRKPSRMKSRGFAKARPQSSASRPLRVRGA